MSAVLRPSGVRSVGSARADDSPGAAADTGYIECMSAGNVQVPTPPEGLRPAQIGIVLVGRPVVGHAAVTLADVAERGFLQVTEIADGPAGDWRLERPPRQSRPHGHAGLLPFEEALLDGLLPDGGESLLSGLTGQLASALRQFAHGLVRDAVHHGWLRHLHHDQRTAEGEQLAVQIRSFRSGLRHLKASGGEDAIAGHLSYALVFGLASRDRLPHARFAASWIRACSSLPGWRPAEVKRPRLDDPDFTRDEWRGMGLNGAIALAAGL